MIALLFPGQGSQAVGMGCDLCDTYPAAREVFDEASEVLGYDLSGLCRLGSAEELARTEITQPALLAHSVAALRVLLAGGLTFAAALGHSLGEYTALVATGALGLRDALVLVKARGEAMAAAAARNPGAMVAVLGLEADAVEELCAGLDDVWPANFNCPGQVVVSCADGAAAALEEAAAAAGARRVVRLAVGGAFHSPLLAPAAAALREPLAAVAWSQPSPAFFSTCSAAFEHDGFAALLERQLVSPVRFEASIRRLAAAGYNAYLEVGPGAVLTGLVRRIDGSAATATAGDVGSLAGALDGGWITTGEADR
ncbi:MAG TPA: ACP S-malonyltransferase [Thermoleophilia bacterium]|nr:ACP S-malonyltransferase [Thermoleophilia bacterium]